MRARLIGLVNLIVCLWLVAPALATDLYIVPSGGTGNCSNGSPCSYTTARGQAQPGDHIVFKDGNYENLQIVTNKNGITYEAQNKYGATFNLTTPARKGALADIQHDNITIRGFRANGRAKGKGVINSFIKLGKGDPADPLNPPVHVDHILIEHNEMLGSSLSIMGICGLAGCDDIVIRHNTMGDSGYVGPGECLYVGGNKASGALITNLKVYGNTFDRCTTSVADNKPNVSGAEWSYNISDGQFYRKITEFPNTQGVITTRVTRGAAGHWVHHNVFRNSNNPALKGPVILTSALDGHIWEHNVFYNLNLTGSSGLLFVDKREPGTGTATKIRNNIACNISHYKVEAGTYNIHDNQGFNAGTPDGTGVAQGLCTAAETAIVSAIPTLPGYSYAPGEALAPKLPTSLTATKNVSTPTSRIDLAWTKPTQNTDNSSYTDPGGYCVRWCQGAGCTPSLSATCFPQSGNAIILGDVNSSAHTGLTPGTLYRYDVAAFDDEVVPNYSTFHAITDATTDAAAGSTLLVHYDMEDGPTGTVMDDQTANNVDGTLYEGASVSQGPTWITGGAQKIGTYALSCDGGTDNVQIAHTGALDITGDLTIAFWFKLLSTTNISDSSGATAVVLTKQGPTETPYQIAVMTPADPHWRWFQSGAGGGLTFTGTPPIPVGEWHHIAFTRQASALAVKLFIDGNPAQTLTYSVTPGASGAVIRLCTDRDRTATRYANVALDELEIHNVVLSDAEILERADPGTR